jgi:protein-tyrosine phosphatase
MDRRAFLMTAIASGALAAAPGANAAPLLDGRVTRLSDTALDLSWTAKGRPASVYVSSDPDAPRAFMREVKANVTGGETRLALAIAPRPYFLVTAQTGGQVRVAERLLPLKGGRNFRDLGGYRSADGRQVKWGRIYRSGVMSGLTAADMTYLNALGVSVVCDLRSVQERTSEPSPFLSADGTRVMAVDYDMGQSLSSLYRATNRAEAVQAFADAYLGFIDMLAPQYTDMFGHLVRHETPLAMNCSAGKDRTGMGSALVLSVLGVPRETVIADYALTQTFTPPSLYTKQIAAGSKMSGVNAAQAQGFARMPPEVLNVIMGSDPDVMRIALKAVDAKYGGPVELAKSRFGLTDDKVARLRATYLL